MEQRLQFVPYNPTNLDENQWEEFAPYQQKRRLRHFSVTRSGEIYCREVLSSKRLPSNRHVHSKHKPNLFSYCETDDKLETRRTKLGKGNFHKGTPSFLQGSSPWSTKIIP